MRRWLPGGASGASGALRNPRPYLRAKSARRVFDEIVALHRDHGITLIRCQDTNFLTINRGTLHELADLMRRDGPPVRLYVETRLDRIAPADIELLTDLKVDGIGSGIETAGEGFLAEHLNRFQSEERLLRNAHKLQEAGIRLTTYNIIGLPEQSERMILDTIELNRKLNPDSITVAFYSPYVGTESATHAEQLGYFDPDETGIDGQLRTRTKHRVLSRPLLRFYKANFVRLVRSPEVSLAELKHEAGLLRSCKLSA